MQLDRRARSLLWLDGGAAFFAGLAVLVLRRSLTELHGFTPGMVTCLGLVNLVYASYSSALASLASRGVPLARRALDVLILANSAWAAVCTGIVVTHWSSATLFGLAHVAFEGAFVATLALLEYRFVRPQAR